jgi:peptide/nickel transport system substrate-binding protein
MKSVARFLIALLAFAAVSCARRETPAPPPATLYRHLEGDPPTLDPVVTNEEIGLRVEQMLVRPLVGLDKDRRFVPALATSWTVSPDGLVFDFRIDPTARWEDGTPITSEDVAFTIDRIRDPKVAALNWKANFEDVAAVETPDPARVIVRMRRPYAARMFAFNLPIVSKANYGPAAQPDRRPLASAAYRLESWEAGQRVVLARRADQSAQAYPFDRIVFRVLPDDAVRFRAGTRGELDEFRISRDQLPEAQRSEEFLSRNRIEKVPVFSVVAIIWNCRNPILSDARVRRALARSWPREETARRLYPPDGARLDSGPYPAGAAENAADVSLPPLDPAGAAKLLDEAGLPAGKDGRRVRRGKAVSLEYLYPAGQPKYANIGEILREAYGKVGVDLVLRSLDWAAYSKRFSEGEFDVIPMSNQFLPPNVDPYPFYHSSQFPPTGQNSGFYSNPEADKAMEAAQREFDDAKRLELYRQIHRLLAADPPADFLWTTDQYWGLAKRLEGVEISAVGLFHFLPGPFGWRPVAAHR